MVFLLNKLQDMLDAFRGLDFLAPLALRLYLAPIFWMAGTKKLGIPVFLTGDWHPENFQSTIDWFANPDWGLGLPYPEIMAYLASYTELLGAVFLVLGFAVRWIAVPLMVTMVVAMVTVHWSNGWLAIAEGGGLFATDRTIGAIERLDRAKSILQDNANYDWLTENGSLVILNNGIEFAATYFVMLLALFFIGAGRYLSIDYFIARRFRRMGGD